MVAKALKALCDTLPICSASRKARTFPVSASVRIGIHLSGYVLCWAAQGWGKGDNGWEDQAWEGGGIGGVSVLSIFLGPIQQHCSAQTCSSDFTGAGQSWPTSQTWAYPGARDSMSPYLKEPFCLLNFPTGCSVVHAPGVFLGGDFPPAKFPDRMQGSSCRRHCIGAGNFK